KGSLTSDCPIVVKGRIEGDVTAPSVTVSGTGAVHGKIKVGELRSQGELAGEFDADLVQLSGRVKDNTVVRARSIEVKLAPANGKMQVVFGECVLDVGEQPSKDVAVSSALAGGKESVMPPAMQAKPELKNSSPPAAKADGSMPPPTDTSADV